MMSRQDQIVLALAFGCGVVAAVSSVMYLRGSVAEPIPTAMVLVAARDLAPDHTLTAPDIAAVEVPLPDGRPPAGVYTASNLEGLVGRTLGHPVAQGLFLTEGHFVRFQQFSIEPGMCGMPIHPYSTRNFAPGQRIDIWVCVPCRAEAGVPPRRDQPLSSAEALFASFAPESEDVEPRLVLSNVLVKSVGNVLEDEQTTMSGSLEERRGAGKSEVLIEITPEQVRRLLAESRDLRLELRAVIRGPETGGDSAPRG